MLPIVYSAAVAVAVTAAAATSLKSSAFFYIRLYVCMCVNLMWERMCDRIRRNGCHANIEHRTAPGWCMYMCANVCVRYVCVLNVSSVTDIRTRIYKWKINWTQSFINEWIVGIVQCVQNVCIQCRILSFAIWFSIYICNFGSFFCLLSFFWLIIFIKIKKKSKNFERFQFLTASNDSNFEWEWKKISFDYEMY